MAHHLKIKTFRRSGEQIAICLAVLLLMSHAALAQDRRDRLSIESEYFPHPEKSLLLDVQRVGKRLIAVGARGVIIFSDDNAETWTQAAVPVSVSLTSVSFVDEKYGWAVGHSGVVLGSEDGGKSWKKQLDGRAINDLVLADAQLAHEELEEAYNNADEDGRYDLEYELEDALFALEDAEFDAGLGPTKPLLDVHFTDRYHGFAIGAYGVFLQTFDGGKEWYSIAPRIDNIDRFHLNHMVQISEEELLIVGEAGVMFYSDDLGEEWETVYGPYQGSLFGAESLGDDRSVIIYGLRGSAYLSEDGGQSWLSLSLPVEHTVVGSALSGQEELTMVGHSGLVLSSLDKGQTFKSRLEEDYTGYTGAAYSPQGKLILVGETGVKRLEE